MLGLSPLGARPLGAPVGRFISGIIGRASLPSLTSAGTLQRTVLLAGASPLPGLSVSARVTHPYAWDPVPPEGEIWTEVPGSGGAWTPVNPSKTVWS